jgi:hypothetical protein
MLVPKIVLLDPVFDKGGCFFGGVKARAAA